jgi:hypothetical protein
MIINISAPFCPYLISQLTSSSHDDFRLKALLLTSTPSPYIYYHNFLCRYGRQGGK